MKKFFIVVWGIIRSNLVLKIMAVLFAIILWSYVLSETNPPRVRQIENIPLRLNTESLEAKHLAISKSLSDDLAAVDIWVEINQSDLNQLNNKENFQATVDLSTINDVGTYTLDINPSSRFGSAVEVRPKTIVLTIDKLVTNTVPVNVDIVGNVLPGYYANTPDISPNVIDISGARIDVEKVTSALCTIDLNGLMEGYRKSVPVSLLDNDGKPVDDTLFINSLPSVIVTLDVLSMKTVPIDINSAIVGQDNIAPGYEITEITSVPDSVSIVGEKSIIDSINSVPLVSYSVSGASEDLVVPLDFDLPDGVTILEIEKAQIYINIREVTDVMEFGSIDIEKRNLTRGLDAKLGIDSVDVTVVAGISQLSALNKTDIVPYVDLEALTPGAYTLELQFEIPAGFAKENFTSSPPTVTVTISD